MCKYAPSVDRPEAEHRGGNGVYTGPCEVRVIPPGVGGKDLVPEGERKLTAAELSPIRGRRQQARNRRVSNMNIRRGLEGSRQRAGELLARGVTCARCGESGHNSRTCFKSIGR